MRTPPLLVLLPVLASSSLSGCSWLFVQPLPANYERGEPTNCTTSRAAPVVDTLLTLTNVGSAVYVAGQDNVTNKGTAVTAGLLVGALWFSSAIYGYSKTSDCAAAMEDDAPPPRYRRPVTRRPVAPPSYAPPSSPPPDGWGPSVTVQPPTAPPPPTDSGSPGQQQDDDEPQSAPAPPPKRPSGPSTKPDAPRFGG
jgi:hypothetical protein